MMKKHGLIFTGVMVIIFFLSFPSALLAEEGHMHEKMEHGTKSVEKAAENIVIDRVCGMKFKPEDAAGKSEYQGKTYYFCMDADKKAFDKDPDKYIAQIEKIEPSKEMHKGHEGMEGHEHHQEMMQGSHWMAPKEEAEKPNPVTPTEESLAEAKEIFMEKCSICHGNAGAGDGPLASSLDPKPTDLTGKMTRMHPDGDLFYKISKGKGAMPAWEALFSEEERWGLVNFVRSLSKGE